MMKENPNWNETVYFKDYDVTVNHYLTHSEIQAIANAALKFDTWSERNTAIDMLLIHFATDITDEEAEKVGHDKLLKSNLFLYVKAAIDNYGDIQRAIDFEENPMRLLAKLAKEMPEFSKKVDEVMKNAPSKK